MELIAKYFPDLSPQQRSRFEALDPLYREWNARINVISRKDIESLEERHLLHSLGIAKAFSFGPGVSVLDIGTGGGLPGIPLAIFFPEARFHLVDATEKKLRVVRAVAAALGLDNVTTEQARMERLKHFPFDVAVSRAVAPLRELAAWSRPLLKKRKATEEPRGLICLKGGDLAREITESGYAARLYPLSAWFTEKWFEEKYVVHLASV